MVNIIKRMRKLRSLLTIRNGPGSVVLPKEVTKISLSFHTKLVGGNFRGARHFWHTIMPSLKYRNPAIPMSVIRHGDPAGEALLQIYTDPEASNPTHTIDVKTKHESEILEALIEKTGATVLTAPPEELEEMREIEEFKERAEKDRVMVRERLTKERREAELLRLARGEVPASN